MIKLFLFFPFLILPVLGQNLTCPPNYTMVLNKCLKLVQTSGYGNHSAAEDLCRKDGGTHVIIRSAIENRAVAKFAADRGVYRVWIGLYCFGNDTSTCVYDDNSGPMSTYSGFERGYPLVTIYPGHDTGCVLMTASGSSAGLWGSSWCNPYESVSPVCEVPAYVTYPNTNPQCINFDGFCYIKLRGSYDDGLLACSFYYSSTLLSIHSKRENDFIQNLIDFNQDQYYIGAKRIYSDQYAWADGTGWGDFDNRDPLDTNTNELDCLAMKKATGLWKSIACSYPLPLFCKVPLPPRPAIEVSHCNSTLIMDPVIITSYGYPNTIYPPICTWKIATVGAYRLRISFTDLLGSLLTVIDSTGNVIAEPRSVQSIVAPSNYITVVQRGGGEFKADVMPY